jgi:hypothetical protein
MDAVTLKFVTDTDNNPISKTLEGVKIKCDISNLPKEQRAKELEHLEDMENYEKFQIRALEVYHRNCEIVRCPKGFFSTPVPTFEKIDEEADNLAVNTLKSKKEDVEIELATKCEKAITYLHDRISEESHAKIGGGDTMLEVKHGYQPWHTHGIYIPDWSKHEAKTKEEIAFQTAWRDFLTAVIAMYDQKIKSRDNPNAVSEIISEANKSVKERKQLILKIRHANGKPLEELRFKTAEAFVENLEKKRLADDALYTLRNRFEMLATEKKFPEVTDDLTTDDLKNRKKIEAFYKKEITKREASKKA